VWSEDAAGYYSAPTVVFSLTLLVHDVEEAASCLKESGLVRVDMNREDKLNPRLDQDGHLPRFEGPKPSDPWPSPDFRIVQATQRPYAGWRVQLQPATFWNYNLPSLSPSSVSPHKEVENVSFYPPLALFLDALIDGYLDAPLGGFALHVMVLIKYVHGYNDEAKKLSFGGFLRPEHRPFWKEVVETSISASDRERQRVERDEILESLKRA
jgi:hypothetical protein